MEIRKQQADLITSKSGFPAYTSFFPTMLLSYWSTLEVLDELIPLRAEFVVNSYKDQPCGNYGVVKGWIFRGHLKGLLSWVEYHVLSDLIGCR